MVCLLDLERNNHKISCSLLDMNRYKYLLVVPSQSERTIVEYYSPLKIPGTFVFNVM